MNRLHKSGDGDIVVPQRALSVVGTSSWKVEDPDDLTVPEDHVQRMIEEGSKLIPAVRQADLPRGVVGRPPADRDEGRGRLGPRALADLQDDRPRRGRRRRGLRHDHRREGHDAPRHGRAVRRRRLRQARDRGSLPHARDRAAPPRRGVHPGGRWHERRDADHAPGPRVPVQAGRRRAPLRRVRRPGDRAQHRARRAPLDPAAPRPLARAPALVLPRLVRHLRRARERPRGARVRHGALRRLGRHRDGRAAREPPRPERRGVRHDAVLRAVPRRRTRTSARASS